MLSLEIKVGASANLTIGKKESGQSIIFSTLKHRKHKQVDFGKNVSSPYALVASLQPIIIFCMYF